MGEFAEEMSCGLKDSEFFGASLKTAPKLPSSAHFHP
jgi:hypothetical protein